MANESIILSLDIENLGAEIQNIGKLESALGELDKQFELLRLDQKEARQEFERGIKTEKQFEQTTGQLSKRTAELRQRRLQLNRATNNLVKAEQAQTGSLNQLRAQYNLLIQQLGNVSLSTEKGRKQFERQSKEAIALSNRIKELERSYGSNVRNVGNYQSALGGLSKGFKTTAASILGAAGIAGGLQLLVNTLKGGIKIIADFEKATDRLQAITGASDRELERLTDTARQLGATTQFTASQVVSLQTELAKLGFTTDQIVDSQEAILNLALITGEELSTAAELAGSTLRAFGLEASESGRVVDVLAKAFSSSALDFQKFQAAITQVAPVAATFGFTIEETTALLGQLTNAGFRGEQAGTALRNILLNLADANGKLAQSLGGNVKSFDELVPALIELRESGVDLNDTLELTDKRSVAAFNQFLKTAEGADELKRALDGAEGSAQTAADIISDNLEGDLKRLSSAYEAAVLEGGFFNKVLRGGVVLTTDLILVVTDLAEKINALTFTKLEKDLIKVRRGLKDFTNAEEFEREITKINKSLNENIGADPKTFEGLRAIQEAIIIEYANFLGSQTEATEDVVKSSIKRLEGIISDSKLTQSTLNKGSDGFARYEAIIKAATKALENLGVEQEEVTKKTNELTQAQERSLNSLNDEIKKLRDEQNNLDLSNEANVATFLELERQIDSVTQRIQSLRDIAKDVANTQIKLDVVDDFADPTGKKRQKGIPINQPEDVAVGGVQGVGDNPPDTPIDEGAGTFAEQFFSLSEEQQSAYINQQTTAALNIASAVSSVVLSAKRQQLEAETEQELNELQRRKDAGLLTEQQFAQQKLAIEKKGEKERKKLARKEKAIAISEAIIATSLAVVNALNSPPFPPLSIPQAVAAGAFGAAQIATIALQKFAKGGQLPFETGGMINGPRHSQGGVKFMANGGIMEAEGGEIILTRGVAKNPRLRAAASSLNVAGGGKRFQSGGLVGDLSPQDSFIGNSVIDAGQISETISSSIGNLKVVNVVTDTEQGINSINTVNSLSEL